MYSIYKSFQKYTEVHKVRNELERREESALVLQGTFPEAWCALYVRWKKTATRVAIIHSDTIA